MAKSGMALMGIGIATGENRATEAAEKAISHPLLEDISIAGAKAVLMNVTSTSELTMEEMTEASDRIYAEVGEDAEIIWGHAFDETLGDELRVTVIATGIGQETEKVRSLKVADHNTRRGKIRDITPQDMKRAADFDEPTVVQTKKAVNQSENGSYRGIILDNTDLEIPTFLRKKAD
jgi:cell division protein FtsZ